MTQNSLFSIGVMLSKMLKKDSKFIIFDRGYPVENVENDWRFTIFDRDYPIKNVEKWLKVWGATDPPK